MTLGFEASEPDDPGFMARAIWAAEQARGRTSPNPHVGCVIVRDGRIVGVGSTLPAGESHAEVVALAEAGPRAAGATAYVTLEPCAHTGRTPPCTDALLAASIGRVVVAHRDPHAVATGGLDRLRAAGVTVDVGLYSDVVARQLSGFLTTVRHGRPRLTLKLAQTVDGSLQAPAGRWITSVRARRRVHQLRDRCDAVLVGVGTVLADNPSLDVRHVGARWPSPRSVVLDTSGRTPIDAAVVRPGTVIVTVDGSEHWEKGMADEGVLVLRGSAHGEHLDLAEAMQLLSDRDILTVLAEPGATLSGALLAAGLVDELVRHVAPTVQATDGVPRIVAAAATTADWPVIRRFGLGPDVEIASVPA